MWEIIDTSTFMEPFVDMFITYLGRILQSDL